VYHKSNPKFRETIDKEGLIKEERYLIEGEIYTQLENRLDGDKTVTIHCDNLKLQMKPTYSVKVDQEKAAQNPEWFKVKYEMTYSQYKKSMTTSCLDDVVTINVTKPSFSVEMIDD
jgi:hypothetical protein